METACDTNTEEVKTQQVGIKLPKLSNFQLFSLSAGIIGIQFAWSMQIAFSSRVLEPLGANPFLFGLIWCAGPLTGVIVPPLVGAISDRTWTKIGRRRPFIIAGTLIAALMLFLFPLAPSLGIATLLLWIMNASANGAQAPYRALVPDNVPSEQQALANSYINFAYGAGSIISLGVAPLLLLFNIPMSIVQQFTMTSIIFVLAIGYSCSMVKEYPKPLQVEEKKKKESFKGMVKKFFKYDREIHKLCGIQFLTWVGMMSIYIYLTPFVVHNIYGLPDMSTPEYNHTRAIHKIITPITDKVSYKNLNIAAVDELVKIESKLGQDKSKNILTNSNIKLDTSKYQVINKTLDGIILKLASSENYNKAKIDEINQLSQKDPEVEKLASNVKSNPASQNYKNLLTMKKAAEYKLLALGNLVFESKNNSKKDKKIKQTFLNSEIGKKASKDFNDLKKFNLIEKIEKKATNTAQLALVGFNTIALFLSIPVGYLCSKYSKKNLFSISLGFVAVASLFAPFIHTPTQVIVMMTIAGVASATILSLPFALLCDYMPKGEEGVLMGIFNMFLAGPQLISAVVVGWIISKFPIATKYGMSHNWSIAFIIASVCIFLAIISLQFLKEKSNNAAEAN